jgi:hypothetical protein
MAIRLYICPIIGVGTYEDPYRAKAGDLGVRYCGELIPSNADGSPKFSVTLIAVPQASWSALDADPTFERLFGVDLPDTVNTWADLKTFLQSKTVADIPTLRRQALNTRLSNRGFDTSQVTLTTTWFQVLRGMVRQLNNGVLPKAEGVGLDLTAS